MAFAIGNQLAKDHRPPKPFRDALIRAIKRAGDDYRGLDKAANKLLKVAETGNIAALRELADRVDGKVPQGIIGDEGGPLVLQVVKYVVDVGPQVIDVTAQSETLPAEKVISNDVPIYAEQHVKDDGLTKG